MEAVHDWAKLNDYEAIRFECHNQHRAMLHLGIARNHPDFTALAVLDHIFGSGPGFNERLSRIVRDEMGLAYSVGGGITDSADVAPGLFRVYVGTMPDEADRVFARLSCAGRLETRFSEGG